MNEMTILADFQDLIWRSVDGRAISVLQMKQIRWCCIWI